MTAIGNKLLAVFTTSILCMGIGRGLAETKQTIHLCSEIHGITTQTVVEASFFDASKYLVVDGFIENYVKITNSNNADQIVIVVANIAGDNLISCIKKFKEHDEDIENNVKDLVSSLNQDVRTIISKSFPNPPKSIPTGQIESAWLTPPRGGPRTIIFASTDREQDTVSEFSSMLSRKLTDLQN